MKTTLFITLLFFIGFDLCAQEIIVSFQPKSESGSIDSIRATNLRTKESVLISGNNTLKLVDISTGIQPKPGYSRSGSIYPNPSHGEASVVFSVEKNQLAELGLYNLGGQLVNKKMQRLVPGIHRFNVSFPKNGVYLIVIKTEQGTESLKVVCSGAKTSGNSIDYIGFGQTAENIRSDNQLKSALTTNNLDSSLDIGGILHYVPGDYIYYDFYSWYLKMLRETILVDKPKQTTPEDTIKYGVVFHECIDADGNSYKVVKIGDQTWMAENLKTTSYRKGEAILNVTDKDKWAYRSTDAYCWFNNDITNKSIYGALYNRFAVVDNRNLCPVGWHIPKEEEWKILLNCLGGLSVASGKMRESGISHWASPNQGATNESGFSALPGGYRSWSDGSFKSWHNAASWWTATNTNGVCLVSFNVESAGSGGFYCETEQKGMHVRCVMD
jgi:uncharacterized protein (TIGR02145 family)